MKAAYIHEAVMRGAYDCRAQVPRSACPYRERHDRTAWERGWDMQRAQLRGSRSQ